jgi:hypothetical protein
VSSNPEQQANDNNQSKKSTERRHRDEWELVSFPLWMVKVVENLVIALILGAVGTFLVVVFWISMLTSSTEDIKRNQELNRRILENSQKMILERLSNAEDK